MRPTNPIEEMQVYASQSSYIQPPTDAQIAAGVVPLDTLPADWWNRILKDITSNLNNAAAAVQTVYDEILNVLQAADIPPASTSSVQLLAAIQKLARAIATASTAGSVVSSPASGKVSVDANGVMTPNGLGVPSTLNTLSRDVVSAINELLTTLNNYMATNDAAVSGLQNNKAPTNHASSATTYGKGDTSNYGHAKLSDDYLPQGQTLPPDANGGTAATPRAIYNAYQQLKSSFAAGVAFRGTTAEYLVARTIAEGQNGYIPNGALVILTDKNNWLEGGDTVTPSDTFITSGTGTEQVLRKIQNNRIHYYDTEQAVRSDINNMSEGQLYGYPEPKFDVDDMKQYIRNQNVLSDYEQSAFTTTNTQVQFDGELTFRYNGNLVWVYVNDVQIASAGDIYSTNITVQSSATISFKKGDNIRFNISITGQYVRYYKLRDYTDR